MNSFDPLLDRQVPPKWIFTVVPVRETQGVKPENGKHYI